MVTVMVVVVVVVKRAYAVVMIDGEIGWLRNCKNIVWTDRWTSDRGTDRGTDGPMDGRTNRPGGRIKSLSSNPASTDVVVVVGVVVINNNNINIVNVVVFVAVAVIVVVPTISQNMGVRGRNDRHKTVLYLWSK